MFKEKSQEYKEKFAEEDQAAREIATKLANGHGLRRFVSLARSYIRQATLIREASIDLEADHFLIRSLQAEVRSLRGKLDLANVNSTILREENDKLKVTGYVVGVGGGGHSAQSTTSGSCGGGGGGNAHHTGEAGAWYKRPDVATSDIQPTGAQFACPKITECEMTRALKYAHKMLHSLTYGAEDKNLCAAFLNGMRNHDVLFTNLAHVRQHHHESLGRIKDLETDLSLIRHSTHQKDMVLNEKNRQIETLQELHEDLRAANADKGNTINNLQKEISRQAEAHLKEVKSYFKELDFYHHFRQLLSNVIPKGGTIDLEQVENQDNSFLGGYRFSPRGRLTREDSRTSVKITGPSHVMQDLTLALEKILRGET
jgi:hypothetical protein